MKKFSKNIFLLFLVAQIFILLELYNLYIIEENGTNSQEVNNMNHIYNEDNQNIDDNNSDLIEIDGYKELDETPLNYSKLLNKEEYKVNILLLGIEGKKRADTIIFISLKLKEKKIDLISIPRDTYYYEKDYDNGDQRKINATYGRDSEEGCIKAVEDILGVEIQNYLCLDYESVINIVDSIGGVEIDFKSNMKLNDTEYEKGIHLLNGELSLEILRYRKGYANGDLGRIKAQQQFIKAILNKSNKLNIPTLAMEIHKNVKTDLTLKQIISYGIRIKKIDLKKTSFNILPGTAKYEEIKEKMWSYYFYNSKKIEELTNKLSINY